MRVMLVLIAFVIKLLGLADFDHLNKQDMI